MDAISIINLFLLGSIWRKGIPFTASADSFIYIKYFMLQSKICTYRQHTEIQCFARTFYINNMENSLGAHSRIFFLNNAGDNIF